MFRIVTTQTLRAQGTLRKVWKVVACNCRWSVKRYSEGAGHGRKPLEYPERKDDSEF